MKNLLTILALVFAGFSAQAQFVQGPARASMITNRTDWQVLPGVNGSGGTTNISTSQALWCPVGPQGFGVFVRGYGTNAAMTTNVIFTLETSADGVNAISNINYDVVFLCAGVATNNFWTNFPPTVNGVGNISAVRLKSYVNTNGLVGTALAGRLFVEKIAINTR